MQRRRVDPSEDKLSLRCSLRALFVLPVPVGSCELSSHASREHSPEGIPWHNCLKKVDILSMLAFSWSAAFSSLFVVPVGSVVAPVRLPTEGALFDCSIVLVILE